MNQINKCLNHLMWLLNALKEHNKILLKDLKNKMNDKAFVLNKNFQKYFYSITLYLKVEKNIEKGYQLLLSSSKINKKSILTLKNIYLYRCNIQFNEASNYFKLSKNELNVPLSIYNIIIPEMKNIASLLNKLENDMNFLILNLN